jgi:Mg-chelatase subunit ChlD
VCGRRYDEVRSEASLRAFYGPLLDHFGKPFSRTLAAILVVFAIYSLLHPAARPPQPPLLTQITGGGRPKIDVVFCIDSTGSMQGEIDVVKQKVVEMMAQLQKGQPTPYVRFGLVTYRDRGDEYVTKKFELTPDVQKMQGDIMGLVAMGGGDILESVNEGLHVAVQDMNWDRDQSTTRQIFLIGDAGPHMDYANDFDYHNECQVARQHGISVNVIGCSGIWNAGLSDFQTIAQMGGGQFSYLTYRQEVRLPDGRTGYELNEGGRNYVTESKDDSWRSGASEMVSKHAAVAAPSAGGGLREAQSRGESNLDAVMTSTVQKAAAAKGVRY